MIIAIRFIVGDLFQYCVRECVNNMAESLLQITEIDKAAINSVYTNFFVLKDDLISFGNINYMVSFAIDVRTDV